MDNLTNALASMMALQEIARRCGFNSWQCRRFFTNFEDLCDQLGIDKGDPVWQCKRLVIPACAETASRTEDSGWTPFCMF